MNSLSIGLNNYSCLIYGDLKNKVLTKQNLVIITVALAIFALGYFFRLGCELFQSKHLPPLQPVNPDQNFPLDDLLQFKNGEKKEKEIVREQPKIEDAFKKAGLNLVECESAFPQISDNQRYGIRDKTKQKICDLLKVKDFKELENRLPSISINDLDQDLQKEAKRIVLAGFMPKGQSPSREELLGRFDVLAVPCRMDYDANWNERDAKQSFLVHHAAALNIGEGPHAADFADYSVNGKLDLNKYGASMKSIFRIILAAQANSSVKHAVWFPFGMGAFLRYLPKLDKDYEDPQKMQNLRETIVRAFMSEVLGIIRAYPLLQIHLCLPFDDDKKSEANQNYRAFFDLFKQAPDELKKAVQFHLNIDATDLAQRLADEEDQPYRVSLVNGANRKLIGNRWFDKYAKVAIDENLHRRSSQLALFAALLNRGLKPSYKSENELDDRVKLLK